VNFLGDMPWGSHVPAPRVGHSLTAREREVLWWAVQGKLAREIAEILHISKRTVDEHTQKAIRKLGTTNRTQAVALAPRGGFSRCSPVTYHNTRPDFELRKSRGDKQSASLG
jgi:DNA-binding CsgD family transcriptional regulator